MSSTASVVSTEAECSCGRKTRTVELTPSKSSSAVGFPASNPLFFSIYRLGKNSRNLTKPHPLKLQSILFVVMFSAIPLSAADYTIFPNKTRQTIKGIGFEIQSDSIGSGNHGLPEAPIGVPHDLIPSERERLAKEMLAGFRYCRLAGGLYWRGLDAEKKFLQPRWPEQLQELKLLLDAAGVEGVSFEYWSPAPFWKGNQSYVIIAERGGRAANRLRCFSPGFDHDPIYKGNVDRFLADFANAVVTDIKTLKDAGIKTSMWGLQNEPGANHFIYSTCEYPNSPQYVQAYRAVASAIRKHDPSIMLFADTCHNFPMLIAPAMKDPEVASLVDAYCVHTVGSPSESVRKVHAEITAKLPARPWFQNEYEYLTGGATPDRCMNTVQHIMNSFQLAENPTWFWIHVLKPFKNAEASGYSLGFWKSRLEEGKSTSAEPFRRWVDGPEFTKLPERFTTMEMVSVPRAGNQAPGLGFSFSVNQPVTAYLVAEETTMLGKEWEKTDLTASSSNGNDSIFRRTFPKGSIKIPANNDKKGDAFLAPHVVFLSTEKPGTLKTMIGGNSPIQVRSDALATEQKLKTIQPGHWIFNPYNWNAVGSFVKHMPWDCIGIGVEEASYDPNARIFAFKRPNGKVTIVVSNRNEKAWRAFDITTGIENATWKGFRYTPEEAGEGTMGTPLPERHGSSIKPVLPAQSWEFWEQL